MNEVEFVSSTPSGSFDQKCLRDILFASQWADGLLLAGDFGRNSETAMLLEILLSSINLHATITKDALDYFQTIPLKVLARENTLIVGSFAQIQKLAQNAGFQKPLTFGMEAMGLVEALHSLTLSFPAQIMTMHGDLLFAAAGGQVATTNLGVRESWRLEAATRAAVSRIHHPTKPLEALVSSIVPMLA